MMRKLSDMNFEELIQLYISCAESIFNIGLSCKKAVKKNNKYVEKMIIVSKHISDVYPTRIIEFAQLINYTHYKVDIWCAHHVLENTSYNNEIEVMAIEKIKEYSMHDGVEGLGNRMWLKDWYKRGITYYE